MPNYELYYWPLPFRGQFIRAILAYAEQEWEEHDAAEVSRLMKAEPGAQPVAFMGPPVLVEKSSGWALAEMPAIAYYLAETLGLMPASVSLRALALKVVNDANDVIDEITLDGGSQMWTERRWAEFVPRLERMSIWEATGLRHGLTAGDGHLLGGPRASVADIVTATLWGTLAEKFPAIGRIFRKRAPATAGLTERLSRLPSLSNLRARSAEEFGDAYCGGEIEKSMRQVIK
jgi:glutathione S-transferase